MSVSVCPGGDSTRDRHDYIDTVIGGRSFKTAKRAKVANANTVYHRSYLRQPITKPFHPLVRLIQTKINKICYVYYYIDSCM